MEKKGLNAEWELIYRKINNIIRLNSSVFYNSDLFKYYDVVNDHYFLKCPVFFIKVGEKEHISRKPFL